jgi:hypothetical protein
MKDWDEMTAEEKREHDRALKTKSVLSGLGFIAVILAVFLLSKCVDTYNEEERQEAYSAGYNLGYYIAYFEYTPVITDGEISPFSFRDINEAITFIEEHCNEHEEDGFRQGFDDGLIDGRYDYESRFVFD